MDHFFYYKLTERILMIESILNKLSEAANRFKEIEGLLSEPDITKDDLNIIE